ncbi:hypothetical protein WKW80_26940 [Variovorax humicola]|uniref:Uncharacterized protein n=1 Tax=Variovorax humicola TaxID=1769758 RepID=A0ABU8W8L9_9BURK
MTTKSKQVKLGPAPGSLKYAEAMGRQLQEMRELMADEGQDAFEGWVKEYCPFPLDTALRFIALVASEQHYR